VINKKGSQMITLDKIHTDIKFVSVWFCDICDTESGLDEHGSVWCACD
jgi:hypothetical protein